MVNQFSYNPGNTSGATNSTYSNATSGNGGSSGGSGGSSNTTIPTPRNLSFRITSDPKGASILVDGNNTGFVTPYILTYSDTELLTAKRVSVVNGTNNSVETYIISSEVVFNTTDGNTTTTTGGYGGGYSGGGGATGFDSMVISDSEPFNPNVVNFDKPREAQK
jgi:hypothetical protein